MNRDWFAVMFFVVVVGGLCCLGYVVDRPAPNVSLMQKARWRAEEIRAEHEANMRELEGRAVFPCANCGCPTEYRCYFCGKPCCNDCGSGENGTCPECLANGKVKP